MYWSWWWWILIRDWWFVSVFIKEESSCRCCSLMEYFQKHRTEACFELGSDPSGSILVLTVFKGKSEAGSSSMWLQYPVLSTAGRPRPVDRTLPLQPVPQNKVPAVFHTPHVLMMIIRTERASGPSFEFCWSQNQNLLIFFGFFTICWRVSDPKGSGSGSEPWSASGFPGRFEWDTRVSSESSRTSLCCYWVSRKVLIGPSWFCW